MTPEYERLRSICKCIQAPSREQAMECAFVLHRCAMDTPEFRATGPGGKT
jgi:hypothetical protein